MLRYLILFGDDSVTLYIEVFVFMTGIEAEALLLNNTVPTYYPTVLIRVTPLASSTHLMVHVLYSASGTKA